MKQLFFSIMTFVSIAIAMPTTAHSAATCGFLDGFNTVYRQEGESMLAYLQPSAPQGGSCQSEWVTCLPSGMFSGTYNYLSCYGAPAPSPTPVGWTPPISVRHLPTSDASVNSASPNATNGGSWMYVKDNPESQAVLKFNVTGVVGPTKSSKLGLLVMSNSGCAGFDLYQTTTLWDQYSVTWNTRPVATSGVIASAASAGAYKIVNFDLSSVVNGNGQYGFIIKGKAPCNMAFADEATTSYGVDVVYGGSDAISPTPTATPAPTPAPTPTVSNARLRFNLKSSLYNGVGAKFEVYVNGSKIASGQSNSTSSQDFTYSLSMPASQVGTIYLRYINDDGTRNLYLNSTRLDSTTYSANDSQATIDNGALDGVDVIAGQSAINSNGYYILKLK